MSSINISFTNPWLLCLFIPFVLLTLRPYFTIPPKNRRMKNRVVSMGIHIVILLLLTLIIAGLNVQKQYVSEKSDIIILVDQSMSTDANQEDINALVQSVLDETPSDYRVGINIFANDTFRVVSFNQNNDDSYQAFIDNQYEIDRFATNIEQALTYSYEQLDQPKTGRIIVISDGRQTDGSAFLMSKNIAEAGTRIDTIYVEPAHIGNDAQIESLQMSSDIQLGIDETIDVVIQSSLVTDATVTLSYENVAGDVTTESQNVSLTSGENTVSFTHGFLDYGLTTITATIDTAVEDAIEDNNTLYGFVNIQSDVSNQILIIEGVDGESSVITSILSEVGYMVDVLGIDDMPTSISQLSPYSEVILLNVKNEDLTDHQFQDILDSYVKNMGGGLLTIGGTRAYQKEDMNGDGVDSTFQDLLPVEASTDPKAMAVLIVMDASGSMTANHSEKLDLAKAGAIASVEALASQRGETSHQFGLVTFDADLEDVIELTSVDNKDAIISQIESIESGYGTYYIRGLEKAKDMLSDPKFANTQKHIIFLTDGGPQDSESQYMAVLDSLNDVSVSTIALGSDGENGLDPEKVEAMVREFNGRGAYYRVADEDQLYNIMLLDTEQAQSSDFVNEVPFEGIINQIIPELASIESLPMLGGYYATRAKIGANVIAITQEGDPLYAMWYPENSLGKVGSFTSELNEFENSFSSSFVENFIGKAFIRGIVESVLPENQLEATDMSVGYIEENFDTDIRVRTNMNDGDTIQAFVTTPDGENVRIPLSSISKTTFGGTFETNTPGVYQLDITKYDANGNMISSSRTYSTFSYSNEYNYSYDEETSIKILEQIASNGNGSYLYETTGMFSRESQTIIEQIDVTLIIVVTIMLLFLGDIVVRKFKFKWSHEYFGKKYNNDSQQSLTY